jgi:hypothetical protein
MFIAANADLTNTKSFLNKLRPFPILCYICKTSVIHRVDRVLGFFSSRPIWDPPPLLSAGECVPPLLVPGCGYIQYSHARKGWGVQIRTRVQTLWYSSYIVYVLCGVIFKCLSNHYAPFKDKDVIHCHLDFLHFCFFVQSPT